MLTSRHAIQLYLPCILLIHVMTSLSRDKLDISRDKDYHAIRRAYHVIKSYHVICKPVLSRDNFLSRDNPTLSRDKAYHVITRAYHVIKSYHAITELSRDQPTLPSRLLLKLPGLFPLCV